jgi:membrane-bound serine protease (ClpP class)
MAMGKGTTIGDCAPIMRSSEGGIVVLGEKIQSPLRAKFRNLAERNGYPSLLSESMVTMDIGVVGAYHADTTKPPDYFTVAEWNALPDESKEAYASHRTIVREGELLTLTDREAEEHGFSQGSFVDFDAFLEHKGWEIVQVFSPTWSESMVRVLGKFTPILMLLGFGALYMEFKSPGFGLFGTLGILLLGVAFGAKYAVGLAAHTELLLLIAGFALFAVEIFVVPGTFIAGALGIILIIVALTLAMQGFVVPNPEFPWEFNTLIDNLALTFGMAALALFLPLLAIRYALPRLPKRTAVVLDETMGGARSAAFDTPPLAVGAVGETRTGLRPAGKASFDGVTYEVVSRGEFVEPGKAVEVVRIHRRNVFVRALENKS